MSDLVTRPHQAAMLAHLERHPDDLVLSMDLTASCECDRIRSECPDQFLSCGMAEQNAIGVAAGLARTGFKPWLHTFAVFLTRRVYDQVAMSVAYPDLPVRLVGFLPGLTTPGGVTHQATDDIALMRLMPNMRILEPGDASEVEAAVAAAAAIPGPVYLRMLRGQVPRLFAPDGRLPPMRVLAEGDGPLLISSGICTEEALKARAALAAVGVACSHVHVAWHKPFPSDALRPRLAAAAGVVTVENHLVSGGLGASVAELLATDGVGGRLRRLGLQDAWAHGGSRPYLMRECGLDARAVVDAALALAGSDAFVADHDLAAVRLDAVHSAAKAEAL